MWDSRGDGKVDVFGGPQQVWFSGVTPVLLAGSLQMSWSGWSKTRAEACHKAKNKRGITMKRMAALQEYIEARVKDTSRMQART